jgi:hypothetical protein
MNLGIIKISCLAVVFSSAALLPLGAQDAPVSIPVAGLANGSPQAVAALMKSRGVDIKDAVAVEAFLAGLVADLSPARASVVLANIAEALTTVLIQQGTGSSDEVAAAVKQATSLVVKAVAKSGNPAQVRVAATSSTAGAIRAAVGSGSTVVAVAGAAAEGATSGAVAGAVASGKGTLAAVRAATSGSVSAAISAAKAAKENVQEVQSLAGNGAVTGTLEGAAAAGLSRAEGEALAGASQTESENTGDDEGGEGEDGEDITESDVISPEFKGASSR